MAGSISARRSISMARPMSPPTRCIIAAARFWKSLQEITALLPSFVRCAAINMSSWTHRMARDCSGLQPMSGSRCHYPGLRPRRILLDHAGPEAIRAFLYCRPRTISFKRTNARGRGIHCGRRARTPTGKVCHDRTFGSVHLLSRRADPRSTRHRGRHPLFRNPGRYAGKQAGTPPRQLGSCSRCAV